MPVYYWDVLGTDWETDKNKWKKKHTSTEPLSENVMSTATITEWSNNNNFYFKKDCVTYEHVQHPSQQIFSPSQFLSVPSCHSWVWNGAKHRGARVLVAPVPPATLNLCEESTLHLSIRILWFKMNSYYSYLNIFIFQRRGSKRRASCKKFAAEDSMRGRTPECAKCIMNGTLQLELGWSSGKCRKSG